MTKRLLILNSLSDDEINDICELIDNEGIQFYLTPRGRWMGSLSAIWLTNDDQLPIAQQLVRSYFHAQQTRANEMNKLIDKSNKTALGRLFSNPAVVAVYIPTLIIISLMAFLSELCSKCTKTIS